MIFRRILFLLLLSIVFWLVCVCVIMHARVYHVCVTHVTECDAEEFADRVDCGTAVLDVLAKLLHDVECAEKSVVLTASR